MFMMDDFDRSWRESDIGTDYVLQSNDGFKSSDELLTDLSIGTNN